MRRTLPLVSRVHSSKKFLLPPTGTLERLGSAARGMWAQITDPSARAEYESLVEQKIIKDTVLMNARHGSILTMALFHNLSNPLFKQYDFDVKEFLKAAGPAIEVFQDTLARLVDQLITKKESEREKDDDDSGNKPLLIEIGIAGPGPNAWRQQAADDPTSLAARLLSMVSDSTFDDHYHGALMYAEFNLLGPRLSYKYSKVGEVALLDARAKIMDQDDSSNEDEGPRDDPLVVACIEVLFEIAQTYEQRLNDAESSTEKTENSFGIVVFEGYLHGKGPTRWKIAMVREAFEF